MKLRIAHVDSPKRMAGFFVVQERRWLCWEDLYFDPTEDCLRREQVLGNAGITKAEFDDFHDATKYANKFKSVGKRRIREVWPI